MAMYHVRRGDGSELGPLAASDLQALAQAGRIGTDDQIRKSGDDRWIPARDVRGLFSGVSGRTTGMAAAGAAASAESEWYFEQAGQRCGPVAMWVLRQMASDGTLPAKTPVWRDGDPQPVPLSTIVGTDGASKPRGRGQGHDPREPIGPAPRRARAQESDAAPAETARRLPMIARIGLLLTLPLCALAAFVVWAQQDIDQELEDARSLGTEVSERNQELILQDLRRAEVLPEPKPADPVASFRAFCDRLIPILQEDRLLSIQGAPVSNAYWIDVRRTDSLVSPYTATLEYDCDEGALLSRIRLHFALQNGRWVAKAAEALNAVTGRWSEYSVHGFAAAALEAQRDPGK